MSRDDADDARRPAAEEPVERCERHPERVAAGTCGRCGSFACDACFVPSSSRCARCVGIGAIPWEDEGPWLRRLGETVVVLARRPSEALSDAAGVGALGKSWAFGALVLSLMAVAGTVVGLGLTLGRVARVAAVGGLGSSGVALLTAMLGLLLVLAPLKLTALLVTHALRSAAFALAVRLAGSRGRLRDVAWLEGYLAIGAAPLAIALLAAALVADPRVVASSLLVAVVAQEVWIAVAHRGFATRRFGLSTSAAIAVAWVPALSLIALAWLSV